MNTNIKIIMIALFAIIQQSSFAQIIQEQYDNVPIYDHYIKLYDNQIISRNCETLFTFEKYQRKPSNIEFYLDIPDNLILYKKYSPIYYPDYDTNKFVSATQITVLTTNNGYQKFIFDNKTGNLISHKQNYLFNCYDPQFLVYLDGGPYVALPGPDYPNGWQQDIENPRYIISDQVSEASPEGWLTIDNMLPQRLYGNNAIAKYTFKDINYPDFEMFDVTSTDVNFIFPYDHLLDTDENMEVFSTNSFYLVNKAHDLFYNWGFTEEFGNFQQDNFNKGGTENDPVTVLNWVGSESNINNAFASAVLEDGYPGYIVLATFTEKSGLPGQYRHSSLEEFLVIHEYAHLVTTRLVDESDRWWQMAAMHEGWSDFWALLILTDTNINTNDAFAAGGWVTYKMDGISCHTDNYYFGFRRYPYSTDMNKNPLTLNDMDPNEYDVDPTIPRSCLPFLDNHRVHQVGEIWCTVLWECYSEILSRYNTSAKDVIATIILEGQKLSPLNPNMLEARDAIILADEFNYGGNNRVILWKAFAKRGFGINASVPDNDSFSPVTESFEVPNWGDYDQDGIKTTLDLTEFLNDWSNQSYKSDLDTNNIINTLDFIIFLELWSN